MTKVDWIPFSERRPDSPRRVLVWVSDGPGEGSVLLWYGVNTSTPIGGTHWAECPEGPEPDTPEIRLIDRMSDSLGNWKVGGEPYDGSIERYLGWWRHKAIREARQ